MSAATVDPLPGKEWNAHAVAGDVLNRAPMNAPIIAVWIDDKGCLRYSKSNTDGCALSMFAVLIQEMAQSCWRKDL